VDADLPHSASDRHRLREVAAFEANDRRGSSRRGRDRVERREPRTESAPAVLPDVLDRLQHTTASIAHILLWLSSRPAKSSVSPTYTRFVGSADSDGSMGDLASFPRGNEKSDARHEI